MQKVILIVLTLAEMCFVSTAFAEDTNQIQGSVTATNAPQTPSAAEMETAAQNVWLKLGLFAVVAFLGGIVVAGFAFYGAHRAFGFKGVIIVGIIIVLLFFAIGSVLIEAF